MGQSLVKTPFQDHRRALKCTILRYNAIGKPNTGTSENNNFLFIATVYLLSILYLAHQTCHNKLTKLQEMIKATEGKIAEKAKILTN